MKNKAENSFIPPLDEWSQKMIGFEPELEKDGILDAATHLTLAKKNVGFYLVGGTVRDQLLGKKSKDYDAVVTGLANDRLIKILKQRGLTKETGELFGVIKNWPKYQYRETVGAEPLAEPIDFALPRRDKEGGGGHLDITAEVDPDIPIEDDLTRRDFTVNSLAWDVVNHKLVYPTGCESVCQNDLEKKLIRTVDSPEKSFGGDWLRILRAVRFACQLEGFELEEKTAQAIRILAPHLNDKYQEDKTEVADKKNNNSSDQQLKHKKSEYIVSRERVAEEFLKSFYHNPTKALKLYDQLGLLDCLLPEVKRLQGLVQPAEFHAEGDVFAHTALALASLNNPAFKAYAARIDGLLPDLAEAPSGSLKIEQTKDKERDAVKEQLELIVAALWHDIGKAETFQGADLTGDRIRFNNHDEIGAVTARKICRRLKLMTPAQFAVSEDNIKNMVADHMFFIHPAHDMGKKAIYKRLLVDDNRRLARNKLKLAVLDALSSIKQDTGQSDLSSIDFILAKLEEILTTLTSQRQENQTADLLNGREVMEALGIKSGPRVGEIIRALKEAQIEDRVTSKDEALAFIKGLTFEPPQ